jgi:heme-degrading monooxygenase HmoA
MGPGTEGTILCGDATGRAAVAPVLPSPRWKRGLGGHSAQARRPLGPCRAEPRLEPGNIESSAPQKRPTRCSLGPPPSLRSSSCSAMNRIYVAPDFRRTVRERFRTGRAGGRHARVRLEQGAAPVNPADPYVVLTLWESRATFDAWVHSDAFAKGHARSGTRKRSCGPVELELHEGVHRFESAGLEAGAPRQAGGLSRVKNTSLRLRGSSRDSAPPAQAGTAPPVYGQGRAASSLAPPRGKPVAFHG